MPYQPRIGVVRDTHIVFRVAPRELERIDRARGSASRSSYVRDLITRDLDERGVQE